LKGIFLLNIEEYFSVATVSQGWQLLSAFIFEVLRRKREEMRQAAAPPPTEGRGGGSREMTFLPSCREGANTRKVRTPSVRKEGAKEGKEFRDSRKNEGEGGTAETKDGTRAQLTWKG
jgi:hypothetical protein